MGKSRIYFTFIHTWLFVETWPSHPTVWVNLIPHLVSICCYNTLHISRKALLGRMVVGLCTHSAARATSGPWFVHRLRSSLIWGRATYRWDDQVSKNFWLNSVFVMCLVLLVPIVLVEKTARAVTVICKYFRITNLRDKGQDFGFNLE